jgi:hypothetical protein
VGSRSRRLSKPLAGRRTASRGDRARGGNSARLGCANVIHSPEPPATTPSQAQGDGSAPAPTSGLHVPSSRRPGQLCYVFPPPFLADQADGRTECLSSVSNSSPWKRHCPAWPSHRSLKVPVPLGSPSAPTPACTGQLRHRRHAPTSRSRIPQMCRNSQERAKRRGQLLANEKCPYPRQNPRPRT